MASPQSFHELVRSLGANVIETFEFPDHHFYTEQDLNSIYDLANKHDAYILTTEKDIVKLRRVSDSNRVLYVEISIKFLSGEEEILKLVDSVTF